MTLLAAKILPAQSRTDGDAFWLKATRDVHTATAAAYGVITVDDVFDRAAQITGGRLLARLHLAATSLGLGFHHMNQITERIDRDRSLGQPDAFSARWAEGSFAGRPALAWCRSGSVAPYEKLNYEPASQPHRHGLGALGARIRQLVLRIRRELCLPICRGDLLPIRPPRAAANPSWR